MTPPRFDLRCQGCRLLYLAMGGHVADPIDVIAGVVPPMLARFGCALGDVVVVVGPRGLDLPLADEKARGPYVFGAVLRAELAGWAGTDPVRLAVAAGAAEPPPEGRVYVLVGVGTKAHGAVVMIHHDLPKPTTRAELAGVLSLVPEDGGPAPGRCVVNGGRA